MGHLGGTVQPDSKDDDAGQKDEHFANYAEYSRTLRAWLVAYGIGGPVLFATNDGLAAKVESSGRSSSVISLFLVGVGLQILLALINKWCAWHMYRGAGDLPYQHTRQYRFWYVVNENSWLDLVVDLVSIAILTIATGLVLHILLSS